MPRARAKNSTVQTVSRQSWARSRFSGLKWTERLSMSSARAVLPTSRCSWAQVCWSRPARSRASCPPAASAASLSLSAASFSPLNRLRSSGRKPARSGRLFCGSSKATKNTFSPGAEAARRLALRPQSVSAATCPGTSPRVSAGSREERASPRCSPRADTAAGFMKTTCSPSVPMTASSADSKSAAVFL